MEDSLCKQIIRHRDHDTSRHLRLSALSAGKKTLRMKPLSELKIAVCSDHAGYELKGKIIEHLRSRQAGEVKDCGTYSAESVDYPDFAHPLAHAVATGECDMGIACCGSGNGVSMTINRHTGVRAALCWKPELAALARQHNNANVLSLPARFISTEEALALVDVFFATDYEGGRHQRRVEKIERF